MKNVQVSSRRLAQRASAVACGAFAASAMIGVTAASAQEKADPPVKLSFNVGANSDYVFRGISQTDENPSVFGGVDATIGGIGYAGVWVSNVDFNNGTNAEFDLYGGVKPVLGKVTFDFGAIYYGYTDQPKASHEDYWEFKAAASVPAGPATVGAAVFYSPEFFGKTGKATYYEVNAAAPIPNSKFSVSGALGRQQVEGPADYTTWNAGVGYAINDHLALDVRYWDTDEHGFGKIFGSRGVVGLKASF